MNTNADDSSATAKLIARSTIWLHRDATRGRFVSARAAHLSRRFVEPRSRADKMFDLTLNASWIRPLVAALERLTLPGIQLHYALRKLYLEQTARDAIADGAIQVVTFGAGYDTLSLRLHEEYPQVEFIEADHPATQAMKIRAVDERAHARNLHFVALDLTQHNFQDTLLESDFYSSRAATHFIAEGVLMYLDVKTVETVFAFALEQSGRGSSFAFTFMEQRADGSIAFRRSSRLIDFWLRRRGEPFKWGIKRAHVARFLAAHGFSLTEMATVETLRRRYLAPMNLRHLALAEGESICVARAGERVQAK